MTQIIRTKGYKYTRGDGEKIILLPLKGHIYFKGIVIGTSCHNGTFILHESKTKKINIQYRLDDTIYPFEDWLAKSGDVFKCKNRYYMWTSSVITKQKRNHRGYTHFTTHPAVYDFKEKKLIDFLSLDQDAKMTIVKMKICGNGASK